MTVVNNKWLKALPQVGEVLQHEMLAQARRMLPHDAVVDMARQAVDEARQGFLLTSTKYQCFGVGLPFDAAEGEFHQEGDYFWLRGQERRYPKLALRVGVGTELTLSLAGKKFPLYEKYQPGTLVTVELMPLWKGLVMDE